MLCTCEICDYNTDRPHNLKLHKTSIRHLRNVKLADIQKLKPIVVEVEQVVKTDIDNDTNIDSNVDLPTKETDIYDSLETIFTCKCGTIFESQNELKTHVKSCNSNNLNNLKSLTSKIITENTLRAIILNSFGIVYLIQPTEFLCTNVYKIGMSDKTNVSRLYSQGADSRCIFVMECNLAKQLETNIKNTFKQKFKIYKGSEYFEGDELEITNLFIKLCIDHRSQFCLSKFSIQNDEEHNKENLEQALVKKQLVAIEKNIKTKIEKKIFVYECGYCHRKFNNYQGRWSHIKICKVRKHLETINKK